MDNTKQLARLRPYAARLLEDDYVQDQIATAVNSLRAGQRRARGKSARSAAGDRRLRQQLATAAAASGEVLRIMREPQRPTRHPVRRVFVGVALAAGAAVAWRQMNPGAASLDHG